MIEGSVVYVGSLSGQIRANGAHWGRQTKSTKCKYLRARVFVPEGKYQWRRLLRYRARLRTHVSTQEIEWFVVRRRDLNTSGSQICDSSCWVKTDCTYANWTNTNENLPAQILLGFGFRFNLKRQNPHMDLLPKPCPTELLATGAATTTIVLDLQQRFSVLSSAGWA